MTSTYLLLLVGITAVMSLVTAVRRKALDWVLVHGGFAVAAGVGYVVAPERAGVWLIGPFLVFAIAPLVAIAQVNRMLAARRSRAAGVLVRIAYVLHPSAGHRQLIRINEAYRLAGAGKVDEAAAILRDAGHGQDLELETLRLENRWDDIIAYIEAATPTPASPGYAGARSNANALRSPIEHGAAVLYIRALGETGRLDRLIDAYFDAMERWLKRDDMTEEIAQVRLFVAAFLGQPALVDEICAGPLRHLAPSIQRYWLAIAHAAGGDAKLAQTMFTALQADPEARMRSAAAYRIAQPPARVEQLGEGLTKLLGDLRERLRDAATYGPRATHPQRAVLSYAIVAVLVAIHAYVVWQQRTDRFAVYEYTLFWSPAVLDDGEYWRLVSAVLIHAGWMHLAMNVLGLLWFAPFVERFLGRVRFAVVFLAGGIGGYAVLAAIVALGWRDATAALGASGAVMALIGASIGIFLRASSRSQAAANRLRDMLGFVGVQVVFDILAPRVSMTAHVAGLAIGCALGFAMARRP